MSQINESALATPGVYVNEIPSFPPSVAQVATAIPAFIGYTEQAIVSGKDVTNQAVRISSLVEYVLYFGMGPDNLKATVDLNPDNSVGSVTITPTYQVFNAIQLFFNQGGSNCYIISVGSYKVTGTAAGTADIADFDGCFDVLQKQDEPTLIVVPDAVMFSAAPANFNNLMTSALGQCAALQDRFTIMDVLNGDHDRTYDTSDVITVFRNGVGTSNLSYGAAYYPWLLTSLQYTVRYQNITFNKGGAQISLSSVITNPFLTQLDAALADKTTPPTPVSVTGSNWASGVAETRATGTVTITTVAAGNAFSLKANGNAISGTYTAVAGDTAAIVATKLAALVTMGGYSATAAGAVVTVSAPAGAGISANTTALTASPAANATVVTFANGVNETPATGTLTIAGTAPGNVALSSNGNPIGSYNVIAGDTVNNIASKLAGAVSSGSATATNAVVTVTSPAGSGTSLNGKALAGTFTPANIDNLINNLESQLISSNAVYAAIDAAIKSEGIVVPPSGAIAGVYASVDGTRGVWKAPANVSLNSVIAPMVNIDDNMQGDLNIDTNAGKSVNAIRSFTGKGVLVWGSRTLAGNDGDWKFIPVRRFYIMVEESVKSAAFQFVFEPNDGRTWIRLRAMVENYLTGLWRQGALAGPKPESAFYVKVGLGQTMTFQDILDGKMIVEVGMAPVRPAEFIILRFSQIQQQA